MQVQIAQIMGIAYYEFRMLWRERALLVLSLALLGINLTVALISNQGTSMIGSNSTQIMVGIIWLPIAATLALLLPIMVADNIPKDSQLGVRELLDSLPLSHGVYLCGKFLGVCFGALVGITVVLVISMLAFWLVLGAFDVLRVLAIMWVGALWLIIFNGGLGVFLAASQPSRRRAAMLILAIFVTTGVVFGLNANGTAWDYFSPVRLPILYGLTADFFVGSNMATPTYDDHQIALATIAGLFELLVVGGLAWVWMRWRESRV